MCPLDTNCYNRAARYLLVLYCTWYYNMNTVCHMRHIPFPHRYIFYMFITVLLCNQTFLPTNPYLWLLNINTIAMKYYYGCCYHTFTCVSKSLRGIPPTSTHPSSRVELAAGTRPESTLRSEDFPLQFIHIKCGVVLI